MLTDREARQQIVQITNELFQGGHLTSTGGNISATASQGETLWITPSGLYKGGVREEDLVHVGPDGAAIEVYSDHRLLDGLRRHKLFS